MLWKIAKPLLFQLDAENAHRLTLHLLQKFPRLAGSPKRLPLSKPLKYAGLQFTNPIGLAAGLDKNAEALMAWQNLGFGFAEVGTVTALAQTGNARPRLFRLPDELALFNRMGFNNDGAQIIAHRIAKQRSNMRLTIPIGVNIGKSATVPIEGATSDYCASFEAVADVADYIAINVSSPNTKNLRTLQNEEALTRILEAISNRNEKRNAKLPIFVKIAPDLDVDQATRTCIAALDCGVTGIIVSNTTTKTLALKGIPEGGGGLSGAPLFAPSTMLLRHLRQVLSRNALLIGSGGVMSSDDANTKFQNGADLVQIYSGLIYNGPQLVKKCVRSCTISRIE